MTGEVLPDRQCTMPTCEREATNPDADGSLCERHIAALDGDSPDENPGFDGAGSGSGAAIPDRFKERRRWLLWDASAKTPRRPHWRGDFDGISWNDPDDWHTYEEAIAAAEECDTWGIGYVFQPEDDEFMIDVDGPFDENGEPREWFPGLDRFAEADAYMELSPSSNGVHIPIEGQPPEWWRDSDVEDADHQGVDVLTNKFCTFTGDQLDESGDAVADVNANPFLFDAYLAIRREPPQFDTDDGEGEYDSDHDLTKAQVEDALDHVDEHLHYNDWLRVGFAVYDWDSGSTGKRVFEDWSKGNAKWDAARGQSHIDDIWNNDSANGEVTVGTLIHHAKEGGWIPPWHGSAQAEVVDLGDDADDVDFHGPPEPITPTDGDPAIVHPNADNTGLETSTLTTHCCQRCGAYTEGTLANGELQPPYECQGCECQGPFKHPLLEEYPNLSPNALVDPQWRAPSDVDGSHEGYDDLWNDIRAWIHENWVADDEHLYDGLTAFAISTWLRPNFNFLPHIMVMGKHETGKTRLLNTLAYVSYRGRVPVSFTPAAMFRTVDAYNITLFLSEYHDLNQDLKDEVNAVIKGSQKRGEDVMRIAKGPNGQYEPANFDIFTHMGIGTQFDPPDDIISRCIQIQTTPADRDVPVWFDEDTATELRNRLVYARFRLLDSEAWTQAEHRALEWINERGISGRLREKLLCLVTVASHWDQLDAIDPFVDWLETEAEEATADSDDAIMIQAIRDEAIQRVSKRASSTHFLGDANPWNAIAVPYSAVTERFNEMTGRDVGPTYVGQIRKRLDLEKARHSDGTVIKDANLETKLQQLCEENNLDWEVTEPNEPVTELDDGEKGKWDCSECGEARATHDHTDGGKLCSECADHARTE